MERNAKYRSSQLREDPSIAETASRNTGSPASKCFTVNYFSFFVSFCCYLEFDVTFTSWGNIGCPVVHRHNEGAAAGMRIRKDPIKAFEKKRGMM